MSELEKFRKILDRYETQAIKLGGLGIEEVGSDHMPKGENEKLSAIRHELEYIFIRALHP